MTLTLFMALLATFSVVVSLITEALKKMLDIGKVKYSSNVVVLILSIVVGIAGTAVSYVFLGIAFTVPNIVCMVLMAVAIWVGAMVGYDKVVQMIKQLQGLK